MDGTIRLQGSCPGIPARGVVAMRCEPAPRAFSLIELLVVIGIITLVIAILVPALSRVRTAAMNVVCAGRLRELTLASRMYCDENRVYPEPLQQGAMDPSGQLVLGHAPHQVSTTLLNQLRPYLKFPEVDATTEASKLPPFVQCPFAEEQEVARGPSPSCFDPQVATYYTGYVYLARLDETPLVPLLPASGSSTLTAPLVDQGRLLKPNRAAGAKDKRRAVLWADHVYRSQRWGGFWQY
ncbi:MAG: type II secretion system protein, partial [Tepidisphaeraceae bacterium]